MIDSEKQRLRRQVWERFLQKENGNSLEHRNRILTHAAWKCASTVLLYAPLPGEPDPTLLIPHRRSRVFLFPRIEGKRLGLYRFQESSRWITGSFGLKEPDPDSWQRASPGEIDLALIPGLAFDAAGGRMGRGKGYYDRLLGDPAFRGVKIGLCWSWQIVNSVPQGPLDILMDGVITEESGESESDKSGSMLDKQRERE